MKKQILLNGITNDIAPTLLAGYYKYGVATLIKGNFGTSGGAILEIETMQELINTDSNGNAKAIRACYGQCGFDSVLRAERTEQCKQLRKMNGDKGMKFNQGNKEYSPRTDGVSNTLSTSTKDNMLAVPELRMEDGCMVDKEGRKYRIRKLTPTECFRLMDVNDKDIEKMKSAGIAKTNLYKLAGNSIVVSCMFHLFRKLFIEKGNEKQQLELF